MNALMESIKTREKVSMAKRLMFVAELGAMRLLERGIFNALQC